MTGLTLETLIKVAKSCSRRWSQEIAGSPGTGSGTRTISMIRVIKSSGRRHIAPSLLRVLGVVIINIY